MKFIFTLTSGPPLISGGFSVPVVAVWLLILFLFAVVSQSGFILECIVVIATVIVVLWCSCCIVTVGYVTVLATATVRPGRLVTHYAGRGQWRLELCGKSFIMVCSHISETFRSWKSVDAFNFYMLNISFVEYYLQV